MVAGTFFQLARCVFPELMDVQFSPSAIVTNLAHRGIEYVRLEKPKNSSLGKYGALEFPADPDMDDVHGGDPHWYLSILEIDLS